MNASTAVTRGKNCNRLACRATFCSGIADGTTLASSKVAVPTITTMLRLNDAQRTVLIQALPAVAHLALGAMVFGQFLRDDPFSWRLASGGVGLWFFWVSIAVLIAGGKQ